MLIKHLLERSITRNSFTHDDREYNLTKLNRIIKHNDIKKFRVNKLTWIFKHDDPFTDEPKRIKTANIKVPIIVTKWRHKLVVLDGLHRLCKADIMGLNHLPGRLVTPEQLKKCLIRKLNESTTQQDQIVQNMIRSMFNDVVRGTTYSSVVEDCIYSLQIRDTNNIGELFQPYQDSILDWLKYLGQQRPEYVGELVIPAWHLYQATKWTTIVNQLNELKPKLIRSILLSIQRGHYGLALAMLKPLQEIPGCDWSELKTIRTSTEYEIAKERSTT